MENTEECMKDIDEAKEWFFVGPDLHLIMKDDSERVYTNVVVTGRSIPESSATVRVEELRIDSQLGSIIELKLKDIGCDFEQLAQVCKAGVHQLPNPFDSEL